MSGLRTMRWLPVVVALAAPATVSAQTRFEVRAGAAFPIGPFSEEEGPSAGFANTGFTVGGELLFGIGVEDLDATVSLDILVNPMADDPATDRDGGHTTVPLMAGVRWWSDVSPGMAVFISGHGGVGVYIPPSLSGHDFGPLAKAALALGTGAVLRDRVVFAARLYPLGDYEVNDEIGDDMVVSGHWDVSLITLTVGLRL